MCSIVTRKVTRTMGSFGKSKVLAVWEVMQSLVLFEEGLFLICPRYSSFSFCMGEHGGTHLDAPYHFYKEGWTVDQIPPDHLINVPAIVIDVEPEVKRMENNAGDFKLTVEHLVRAETPTNSIPFGGVVLAHTGWSKFWPDRNKYLGIENGTDGKLVLRFPGKIKAT